MHRRRLLLTATAALFASHRLPATAQTPQAADLPFGSLALAQPVADPADPRAYIGALIGDTAATARMLIYSDTQCPYCQEFYLDWLPQILRDYVEPGTLLLEYREHPILGRGGLSADVNESSLEAQTLLLAAEQDAYFPMLDHMMHRAAVYSSDPIDNAATMADAIGIDADAIRTGLEERKYVPVLHEAVQNGRIRGVTAAPTFQVGPTDDRSATMAAELLDLPFDGYETLKAKIDREISQLP